MPGLHLIVSAQPQRLALDLPDLTVPLFHSPEYRHDRIFDDSSTVCFTTSYPGYPITVIETEQHLCVLEGHIYGHSESSLRAALETLAHSSIWESNESHDDVSRWLQDNFGEFVVTIRDKTSGRWVVVNDILGRLPMYYLRADDRIIVSREYPLFHDRRFSPQWDRPAVAERLWLGFVCGSATTLRGVRRLPPASILRIDPTEFTARQDTVYAHCFDLPGEVGSIDSVADELADTFVTACRQQTAGHPRTVVSLSGGLDSRIVSAALQRAGCQFRAFTFAGPGAGASRDAVCARQLADRLGFDWELIVLPPPSGADVCRLIESKCGLLNSLQASDTHYLATITERCGHNTVYLSGDAGDILKPTLRAHRSFASNESVVDYIVGRRDPRRLRLVQTLTAVPADDIVNHLREVIASYPESDLERKYTHFVLRENGTNWNFEGEDRNRGQVFSTTPLCYWPFFQMAMAAPERYKAGHRLYRRLLRRLSPAAADVPETVFGVPVSSPRYILRQWFMARLRRSPALLDAVRSRLRPVSSLGPEATIRQYLTQLVPACPDLATCFDTNALRSFLATNDRIEIPTLERIFSVASAIDVQHGPSLLSNDYADRTFA